MSKNIISWPFYLDKVETFAYWENAFTNEECNEIIKAGNKQKLEKGKASGNDKDYRDSLVSFISPNDCPFIFPKLTDYIMSLNERFFGFDLWGFAEGLQFTVYKENEQKYDKHIDSSYNYKIRKLTSVIQLTDGNDYVGGDLELHNSKSPTKLSRKRGTLLVFPSYVLHAVTPVTKGTRYSLVGWVTGPSFK